MSCGFQSVVISLGRILLQPGAKGVTGNDQETHRNRDQSGTLLHDSCVLVSCGLNPQPELLSYTTFRQYGDQWEKEKIYPAHEVMKKLGNAGLLGINKPVECGGLGLDYKYQERVFRLNVRVSICRSVL